jgi:parallel beta-helix repeat protein
MYLVENFDHDFTSHHDLPEGALYEDEALGGPPFYNSWERIDDWKIRLPGEKKERQAGTNPEERYEERLRELLECARLKNDEEFFHKLEELVDVPHYLTWWAYTTFFLDTHQDRWHNNRFYFDPTSAKFLQIPWDMTILGNPMLKDTLDLNLNPITERLLQSPYYVHVRNKILWETLQGPVNSNAQMQWVDTAADLIRGDIYCDPHKDMVLPIFPLFKSLLSQKKTFSLCILPVTNEMFEGEVNAIKTFLKERAAFLGRILSEAHAELVFPSPSSSEAPIPEYYTSAGCVSIHVGGHTGIVVKEISIQFASPHVSKSVPFLFYGNRDELITRKGERVHSTLSNDGEVYSFNVDELLLPGRDKKPPFGPLQVRYPFAVVFAASAGALPIPLRAEVKGVHPFTNQEVFLEASLTELKDTRYSIPMGKFQSPPPLPRKILWSGVKKITQDFLVHKGEILIINPGTRVELTQGASVLSYGRVVAVGTATSPIVVTRGPQAISWGVVALQGSDASGSVFDHCIFEYGGDDELEGVFYSGALSIYNADATIRNCLFRFSRGDDALNTKFSTTDVMHSTFMDNTADAYDADFSDGLVAQNLFEKNGNDGIDCGTAHPTIRDNRILYSGDKGISIGERSHPVVEGNLLAHCNVGLAIKDQSQPVIRNNEFLSNRIAVSAYQKKKVFGGAQVEIYRSNFKNNKSVSESDEVSSVSLLNCVIDDGRSPQQ